MVALELAVHGINFNADQRSVAATKLAFKCNFLQAARSLRKLFAGNDFRLFVERVARKNYYEQCVRASGTYD